MGRTKGVQFGQYHTFKDWGLHLNSVQSPNPAPKTNVIQIAGSNEVIDLSEIFGEVLYEQRTLSFEFAVTKGTFERFQRNGKIANAIHGQKLKIILDDDKSHYYLGRVDFKSWELSLPLGILTFECICDPYRYDISDTSEEWLWNPFSFVDGIARTYKDIEINGSYEIALIGTNMTIYPTITTTAPMTLEMEGKTVNVPTGTTRLYELPIPKGESIHTLKITGNGFVTFKYRGVTF